MSMETRNEDSCETDAEKLLRSAGAYVFNECHPDDYKEGDPGGGLNDAMFNDSKMNPGAPLCNDSFCSSTSYPDPNIQIITGM